MEVNYDKNKICDAYKELVENPHDRTSIKKFSKKFDRQIAPAAIKVHQRLISAPNASLFNLGASTNNKIELKSGLENKEPVILKVRIQGSYRKFFYFYELNSKGEEEFSLKKNWQGQFDKVLKILVYDVNKHDYSKN
jgi:hypothetical protein